MPDHSMLSLQIKDRISRLLGAPDGFLPLHEPEFLGDEEALINDCIRSGWVSSVGRYVDRFEAEIAHACGTSHGVAVVNGTAALEVALRVAGVRRGDEVLMPSLTFVATANAAHHLGAVPHFVDSEESTLGLDPLSLRQHLDQIAECRNGIVVNGLTGRRLSAVVPVHIFGHPVDMAALSKVANDFDLTIVEDAAEALGSTLEGRPCGSLGHIAALSFNGNKILTTGGGGAVVTNNPEFAARAKHLTTTAKIPHKWAFSHDEVGYNYRMPNLNAALGVAQLAQLNARLEQKRLLAKSYIDAFAGFDGAYIFKERKDTRANYWLNTLVLSSEAAGLRDTVLATLNDAGLMARPAWEPLHSLAIYADCPRADLSLTESLVARIVNLPSSAKLAGVRGSDA